MTLRSVPKPEPKEKRPRKRLQAKKRLESHKPIERKTPVKKVNAPRMKRKMKDQSAWYASKEWAAMRLATFVRDGWKCVDCEWTPITLSVVEAIESMLHGKGAGGDRWLECDHETNVRFGGDERPEDLATRCNLCHAKKHSMSAIRPRFQRAS